MIAPAYDSGVTAITLFPVFFTSVRSKRQRFLSLSCKEPVETNSSKVMSYFFLISSSKSKKEKFSLWASNSPIVLLPTLETPNNKIVIDYAPSQCFIIYSITYSIRLRYI